MDENPLMRAVAALALIMALAGRAGAETGGPRIAATVLPLAAIATNVAGADATIAVIVPPGTDLHEFTLRPQEVRALEDADLVVALGLGLDNHLVKNVGSRVPVVFAATGMGGLISYNRDSYDPHVWLDPSRAAAMAEAIGRALADRDPERAEGYRERARAYAERMAALDRETASALAPLSGRTIVTYHESFAYFARKYGMDQYSLTGPHAETPLPRRVREVYDRVRAERIRAVFGEAEFPAEPLRRLADDLGVDLCELSGMTTGRLSADYYERVTRKNVAELLRCLR